MSGKGCGSGDVVGRSCSGLRASFLLLMGSGLLEDRNDTGYRADHFFLSVFSLFNGGSDSYMYVYWQKL